MTKARMKKIPKSGMQWVTIFYGITPRIPTVDFHETREHANDYMKQAESDGATEGFMCRIESMWEPIGGRDQ